MEEEIILDESYVRVKHIPSLKLIMVTWNGVATKDQYQGVFSHSLDYQAKIGIPVYNFLSDIRKQGVVNPENRKWFEENALPRAINQGLRRAGVVFDGNIFKKYYLNLILQATNKFKLPFKFFSSVEDAHDWFKSFDE